MSVKVFIDGSSGTTGLRIADRLAARPEIELLSISAEGRKDVNERAKVINSADLAFLCLPDAASKEVMPLLRPAVLQAALLPQKIAYASCSLHGPGGVQVAAVVIPVR